MEVPMDCLHFSSTCRAFLSLCPSRNVECWGGNQNSSSTFGDGTGAARRETQWVTPKGWGHPSSTSEQRVNINKRLEWHCWTKEILSQPTPASSSDQQPPLQQLMSFRVSGIKLGLNHGIFSPMIFSTTAIPDLLPDPPNDSCKTAGPSSFWKASNQDTAEHIKTLFFSF